MRGGGDGANGDKGPVVNRSCADLSPRQTNAGARPPSRKWLAARGGAGGGSHHRPRSKALRATPSGNPLPPRSARAPLLLRAAASEMRVANKAGLRPSSSSARHPDNLTFLLRGRGNMPKIGTSYPGTKQRDGEQTFGGQSLRPMGMHEDVSGNPFSRSCASCSIFQAAHSTHV